MELYPLCRRNKWEAQRITCSESHSRNMKGQESEAKYDSKSRQLLLCSFVNHMTLGATPGPSWCRRPSCWSSWASDNSRANTVSCMSCHSLQSPSQNPRIERVWCFISGTEAGPLMVMCCGSQSSKQWSLRLISTLLSF